MQILKADYFANNKMITLVRVGTDAVAVEVRAGEKVQTGNFVFDGDEQTAWDNASTVARWIYGDRKLRQAVVPACTGSMINDLKTTLESFVG